MAQVVARRPDLRAVVNDISPAATSYAAKYFGLTTLTGDAHELAAHRQQYDVVVASDVLYYESNLRLGRDGAPCL
jgi:2-polyprenyl-3-methyl-5-hydroxy-6-metoxy-1,4-benzoquinol methylase